MFPNNINRLIVDGVVDAYDYKKALWLDNLVDTEHALDLFYYHCARVGYPNCALANETDATTEAGVKQRVNDIVQSLYHNPLPVISQYQPDVVTYSNIRNLIFAVLYTPIGGFDILAQILYSIEQGELEYQHFRAFCNTGKASILDYRNTDEDYPDIDWMSDAQTAIACGDGDPQSWMTKADFSDHIKNITKLSPISELWATLRLKCTLFSMTLSLMFLHVRPQTNYSL